MRKGEDPNTETQGRPGGSGKIASVIKPKLNNPKTTETQKTNQRKFQKYKIETKTKQSITQEKHEEQSRKLTAGTTSRNHHEEKHGDTGGNRLR